MRPAVAAACELLGIDPLYVANEGKLVAVVPPDEADAALAALRAHPLGSDAVRMGDPRRTAGHRGAADLHGGDPDRRHARRRPAATHLLTGGRLDGTRCDHHCVEWASVRSRMPKVARRADSGMTGKMLASLHCGSMFDQS